MSGIGSLFNTYLGVDMAKDVMEVCVYENNKVQSNTEMAYRCLPRN